MKQINAIITIAYRDILKFFRDRTRIIATFIFPFIFIGILGGSFQSNLGGKVGFNFLDFIFIGVLAQTLFQSSAAGIISLIEDKENDFSQEIFVSPISRVTILLGKILGESSVAFLQAIGILIFGFILRIPLSFVQIFSLIPALIISCFLGGSFGILVMSQLKSQKAANQIFPFLLFPQFFLAGVFSPIGHLPWFLFILSRISPMTYAVDLVRDVYYFGSPTAKLTTLYPPIVDITIMALLFIIMMSIGTYFFVRNQGDK